jgi:hypothetical protein
MIPREEVELDDATSYNIFDNKTYKISNRKTSGEPVSLHDDGTESAEVATSDKTSS